MKKTLTLIAGLLLAMPALKTQAQNTIPKLPRCGYELVWKNLEKNDPEFRRKYDEYIIGKQNDYAAKPTGVVYRIPVVFHVVYYKNGATEKGNVADSILQHQITILNDAYRKRHADTGNLRAIFKPLSADAEIEFYLATKDPDGANTTGITRTPTTINGFGDISVFESMDSLERIKHTAQGGKNGWPSNRYLNIWVADMSINFGPGTSFIAILGYATPPLNPLPPNWGSDPSQLLNMGDGVVLQYHCVGGPKNPDVGEVAPFSSAGRTAVHEVGHYLGLRHIWGDPADDSLACTSLATDGINDTPDQARESSGNPSSLQNTCHDGEPGDQPDLWENYMDYSDDANVVMFTHGQVSLMRSILADQRDSLVNQSPTGFYDKNTNRNTIVVYPQPARQSLLIAFEGKIDQVVLTDVLGKTVQITRGSKTIDVSGLPSGMYFLKLQSGHEFYTRQVLVEH